MVDWNSRVGRIQHRRRLLALHCTQSVVWVELWVACMAFDHLETEELARRGALFGSAELGFVPSSH